MAETRETSLPMPGGSMPPRETLVPYNGGNIRMSPEAELARRSAAEFSQAFPESVERAGRQSSTQLDAPTKQNLDQLKREMRANQPRPATIINLHPFELQISTSRFTRGIRVPACQSGQPYAYLHVRGYMWADHFIDGGDGARDFKPVRPIQRAAEFLRTFNDKELWGSGVIVYEGEMHPDKAGEVETYDNQGVPITTDSFAWEEDDDSHTRTRVTVPVPVKRKLSELIDEAIQKRNAHYLRIVQAADQDYRLPDGRGRKRDFAIPRLMAEVLKADGELSEVPTWSLATRLEKGQAEENCPSCGNAHNSAAFKCQCGHVLNPLEAYKHGAIEYGHISMETMASEEWAEAEQVKAERDEIRAKRLAGSETHPKKAKS